LIIDYFGISPQAFEIAGGLILINSILVFIVLSFATPLAKILRETGAALLTRILGLILRAVGCNS
jgi:small neutral amino acid transporter SnatA (MarC family)